MRNLKLMMILSKSKFSFNICIIFSVRKNSYKKHWEEKHGTISSTQIASENSTPQKQCGQPLVKVIL